MISKCALIMICAGYATLALLIFRGIFKNFPQLKVNHLPKVSVVLPVKDEEENIIPCLKSLSELQYPDSKLEIVVVNHQSRDNTGELVSDFIRDRNGFIQIDISSDPAGIFGKAAALSEGIKNCTGEIIFFTDADCRVPRSWISEMVKYFTPENGVVLGFAQIQEEKSFFSQLQSLDWLYFLSAAAGAAGICKPLSWPGNNFAIRKEAYLEVGGYESIGPTVTEDFALLKAVQKKTDWKIAVCWEPGAVVESRPSPDFSEFISQRRRWSTGIREAAPLAKMLIGYSFFIHLLMLLFFAMGKLVTGLLIISFVFVLDGIMLARIFSILGKWKKISFLPIYKLFAFFYMLILGISFIVNRKIDWKGIRYSQWD